MTSHSAEVGDNLSEFVHKGKESFIELNGAGHAVPDRGDDYTVGFEFVVYRTMQTEGIRIGPILRS